MSTPAEKGKITRATNEADPTTYSSLPPEKFKHTDTITILDTHTNEEVERKVYTDDRGSRYFEITHFPRTQLFIARVLKGIVNVTDVHMIKPARKDQEPLFLSKELSIEKIEQKPDADLRADLYVLGSVFRDVDRSFPKPKYRQAKTDLTEPRKGGNMRMDDGRTFQFDFESPHFTFFPPYKMMDEELDANLAKFSTEEATRTLEKLTTLAERVAGEEGMDFLRRTSTAAGQNAFDLFKPVYGSTVSYEGVDEDTVLERFANVLRKRISEHQEKLRQRLTELQGA